MPLKAKPVIQSRMRGKQMPPSIGQFTACETHQAHALEGQGLQVGRCFNGVVLDNCWRSRSLVDRVGGRGALGA